jgi:hypothetical protein
LLYPTLDNPRTCNNWLRSPMPSTPPATSHSDGKVIQRLCYLYLVGCVKQVEEQCCMSGDEKGTWCGTWNTTGYQATDWAGSLSVRLGTLRYTAGVTFWYQKMRFIEWNKFYCKSIVWLYYYYYYYHHHHHHYFSFMYSVVGE